MKKLLNILLAASLIVALASCKDEEPAVELKLSDNTVELKKDGSATVTIESGNGGYEVKPSSNETVATASLSGTTVTIKAVGEGTATITVTDAKSKSANIAVTVSYTIPTSSRFVWNGTPMEFDKAGGYGISILSNGVALTDLTTAKKQYLLSWTGGLSEGDKTGGSLVIAEPGKTAETVTLTSVKVVQSNTSGNYLVFGTATQSGELFFN